MITRQQDHELRELLIRIVQERTLAFKEGRGRTEWVSVGGRIPFEDVQRVAQWLNIETRELSTWWQHEWPSFLLWAMALDDRISEGYRGDDNE